MVRHAVSRVPAWERVLGRRVLPVCADIEHLPLRFDSIDLVWSNLALQWVNAPLALAEFKRVLKPGGLLMFSTFGPDTLKELRAAYAGIDAYSHVNRFIDMHDLGDMLVHAGFADPVMDMEYITLTYGNVRALMRDLKAIGASSVSGVRASGMTTRSKIAALEARYENFRRDGKLPATFEVVYRSCMVATPAHDCGWQTGNPDQSRSLTRTPTDDADARILHYGYGYRRRQNVDHMRAFACACCSRPARCRHETGGRGRSSDR